MIYRKILIWFTNTKIYSDLLLKIIPYIRISSYYTPFRGNQYNEAYEIVRKGDIIVCRDDKKLTTILIGDEWTHAALFLGKKEEGADYECAEMTHHNYTKSDFFDLCKESSRIAIYRPINIDSDYVDKMVEMCKSFSHALYDVGFEIGVRALYCSELIYQSDYLRKIRFNLEDIRSLGREYISPTGLTKSPDLALFYDSGKTKPRY